MAKLKLPKVLTASLLTLLFWSALGLVWAPVARQDDWLILSLSGILIAGLVFMGFVPTPPTDERRRMQNWFLAGFGLANLIMLFELITLGWISRKVRKLEWFDVIGEGGGGENIESFLSNGIVILVLLTWPAATVMNQRRKWGWTFAAIFCVSWFAIYFGHSASLLAIIAGLLAWGIARFSRFFAAKLIAVAFTISVITAPLLVIQFLDASKIHQFANSDFGRSMPSSIVPRLSIWEFVARKSMKRPVLGWGLNSSRIMPGGGEKAIIYDERIGNGKIKILHIESKLPLHPHNQALQIWLELGGVAAVLVAIFGGIIIFRFSIASKVEAPIFGLITSYLVYSYSSFGAWQNWWIATLFLVAVIWQTLCLDPKQNLQSD